ncbi:uncharacterized protein LOC113512943 isoform X2 [Galleria mellonella]|uniref:Uncharacterized protein LOC113512943 isoform X2 n=1 Tax=Galleria mellonella TaxID=7137 RepID=A0A6J1WNF1_GALME|nr:uncharacterized protein LOC113512943 isoform X2 [Galleria mellonella]
MDCKRKTTSMSTKSQRSVKLPAKEMIVTRYKSAQQKRQLRNKDRSMKSITQLLKSPTSKTGQRKPRLPSKKPQKSPETHATPAPKKLNLETKEYITPTVLKKKPKPKKVWLKPNYEMKMVARTNKRKLCTPQREPLSLPLKTNIRCRPIVQSPVYSELSMPEVIQLVEDTGQLDDEDLMEILTCPSPVWWEDPPEPWYTENPIPSSRRISSQDEPQDILKVPATDLASTQTVKLDPKYIRKRSNLEMLLEDIRNKANKKDTSKVEVAANNDKKENVSNEIINDNESMADPVVRNSKKTQSESTEGDLFDVSFHDDILTNLENIEIPIANSDKPTELFDEFNINTETNDNVNHEPETLPHLEYANDVESHLKTSIIHKQGLSWKDSSVVESHDSRGRHPQTSSSSVVPMTLPPLKKYPLTNIKRSFVSPVSIRSSDDASSVDQEADTISDTNIKYLLDDDEQTTNSDDKNGDTSPKVDEAELIDDTSKKILEKIKQFFKKKSKSKNNGEADLSVQKTDSANEADKKKFITVYKIMSDEHDDRKSTILHSDKQSNESNIEISNEPKDDSPKDFERGKSKINSFYKKCKSINRRKINELNTSDTGDKKDKTIYFFNKINETDTNSDSKTIEPNGSVKYCFKCSSIFETSFCTYCSKNNALDSNKQCNHKTDNTLQEIQTCTLCEK